LGNNRLQIEIAKNLPHVYGQAEQIARVPQNLLENAADATKNGTISLNAFANGEYITVQISDTGEGISPEIFSRVFERGISGKGSKGYGLYMCKTIVEAHGGTIEIASAEGRGTAVTFTIPLYGGQSEVWEQ
jgi:signal transduction histidine kinase